MGQPGSNGFEGAKQFVADIERHYGTLDTYRGEYMKRCRDVRDLIAQTYDRAKDAGIPKKELKAVIKARDLKRKIEALRENLEEDGAETFDQIRHALGDLADLPLGDAALKRAAAVDSLVSDEFDQADPAKAHVADNVTKLRGGIQPTA